MSESSKLASPPTESIIPPSYVDEEKRLLVEWDAPSRPFKKRDKDFFTTVTTLAVLCVVILFFMKEFLVICVVFALVFLVYVLYSVPPEPIHNALYTTGIQNGSHFYAWPELYYYWFEKRWDNMMLVARTRSDLPGAIYLLVGDKTREELETAIGTRLILKDKADSNVIDRAAAWLGRMFPMEKNPQ
jgi:hypothetical protein